MPTNVVGSLVVKLLAQTAEFRDGLRNASQEARSEMRELASELTGLIPGPLGAIAGMLTSPTTSWAAGLGVAVMAMRNLALEAHETVTAAEKMGIGVERFQQLQVALHAEVVAKPGVHVRAGAEIDGEAIHLLEGVIPEHSFFGSHSLRFR